MEIAKEKQEEYELDMRMRLKKKVKHDREMSENNFKQALQKVNPNSGRFSDRGKAFITESPDQRSNNSRTQSGFFGTRSGMMRSAFYAQDNKIKQELATFYNKVDRGFNNSLQMKQMRI